MDNTWSSSGALGAVASGYDVRAEVCKLRGPLQITVFTTDPRAGPDSRRDAVPKERFGEAYHVQDPQLAWTTCWPGGSHGGRDRSVANQPGCRYSLRKLYEPGGVAAAKG